MIIIALFLRLVFSVADPGEGPGGGRLTLFLDQTEAPKAETFLETGTPPPPPPLSEGLDQPLVL